jgi:hypothetical protein
VEPFAIYDTDLESDKKRKDSPLIVDVTYIEAETHEICKKKKKKKKKKKFKKKKKKKKKKVYFKT